MTTERFIEILDEDYPLDRTVPNSITAGLNLIAKYLPKSGVEAAEHDMIYSEDIDKLIEAGITEDDVKLLAGWNWGYDEDCECLYHFC